jgi:hypothetical protein
MVGFSVNMVTIEEKGKTKVLTSAREKQGGSVDPTRQVTLEQVHGGGPSRPQEQYRGWGIIQDQTQSHHAHSPQQMATPAGKGALPEAKI